MADRRILIDWVTATFASGAADVALEIIGETPVASWLWGKPSNGYNRCRVSPFGTRVQWHLGEERMGTSVVISGKVLSALHDVGVTGDFLVSAFDGQGARFSRVDVALDVFNDSRVLVNLLNSANELKGAKKPPLIISRLNADFNAQFGSRASERFVRVYNKRVEQKVDFDWLRIEAELKGKRAVQAQEQISKGGMPAAAAVLKETVHGAVKSAVDGFFELFEGIQSVDLTMPRRETETRMWLLKSVVPALAREISQEDGEAFLALFWREVNRRTSAESE